MVTPRIRNKNKRTIFVDSDAFVALAKSDDSNHRMAQSLLGQLIDQEVVFVTSSLNQRIGHKEALAFIRTMKDLLASLN